ncbi:MAG: hypothetical protein ACTHMF_07430 [Leifsonia sp.]|uniref:hypothetical protein n=1 Tax=Leifsonia sp. TaxID=1870902 RepID=UPI003F7EF379
MKKKLAMTVALGVTVAGLAVLCGAAAAVGSSQQTRALSATTATFDPAAPGADSAVAACTAVFESDTDVTGMESFEEALDHAAQARSADASWSVLHTDLESYANAYVAFQESGYTAGVSAAGEAYDAFAADCAQIGVAADAS